VTDGHKLGPCPRIERIEMNSNKLMKFATAGLGLALVLGGCSSSSNNPPAGSGGSSSGSGGASSSSGGSTGSGGQTSSGGTTGSGGVTSSGGTVGSGGTTSSGGTTGSGGTASGGATGSGGAATGGASASGGAAGGVVGGGGRGGAGSGSGGRAGGSGSGSGGSAGGSGSGSLTLTSPTHMDGAKFDSKYTCAESPPLSGKMTGGLGNGINPELDWSGVPAGTMSFAITFLDMTLINAGMDSLGNHWAMWNIPASAMKLPEGTTMLSGDFAMAKQTGAFLAPCAQSLMNNMDDQYEFTIYALSTATLNVSGTGVANARTALKNAASSVLGTAVLKGHAGVKGM
jgi:phosphatidylethanolamine-binding protein (PEBP) family uncharacterized protein